MTDSPISDYSWLDEEEEGEEDEWEPEEKEAAAAVANLQIVSPPPSCRPTAAAYSSVCTTSTAEKYADLYKVPPEYGLCAPRAEERAHVPPPGYAAVYIHHFLFGLRLPLPPFLISVLAHCKIALAQLHPNGIAAIVGFMELCKTVSITPTVNLFRHFFDIRTIMKSDGWFTFSSKLAKIVHREPLAGRWKASFLFFKTAPVTDNVTFSWNYSDRTDIKFSPLAEEDRPSDHTVNMMVNMISGNVKGSLKRKSVVLRQNSLEQEEEGRMIEANVRTASVSKSCCSKNVTVKTADGMQVKKKSLKENEQAKKQGSPATCTSNATTEPLRLKTMAELYATEPARKKHVDGSSQVLSVPSFKDVTLDQFASYGQKCLRSFYLQLQEDKEELENVVDSLKTEVSRLQHVKEQDRKDNVALLEGYNELEKENASLRAEVSRLQCVKEQDLKDNVALLEGYNELEKENASLRAEVSRLHSVSDVIAAMKQEAKDKNEEIGSLKSQLKSLVDDRGPLLRVYTQKLLESQAFGRLFYDVTTSAQRLGRHEAAEQIQDRFPAIPEDALVGLEDPLAAIKLENLCDMVQDDAFTLLDHLLSLPEIPSSSEMKHLDEDEDQDSMIASPSLHA